MKLQLLVLLLAPGQSLGTPPSQEQIAHWVDQLSAPTFQEREEAVRLLYAAGPAALESLAAVDARDDYEAALRAGRIIERISKLYLVGAQVKLEAQPKRIAWNQPLTLNVHINNPSDFLIRLPFLTQNRQQLDPDPLTRQIGNLLDVADFLELRDPDGTLVDFKIDDYRALVDIERAIDVRAFEEPCSVLPARSAFDVEATEFNCGFARFPMLDKGTYRLRFAYQPEWDDPALSARQLGMVLSNEIAVEVTEAAPELIRNYPGEIKLDLLHEDQDIVVKLTNTYDRPLGVNLNLGVRGEVGYAHLEWLWQRQDHRVQSIATFDPPTPLSTAKLKRLAPAESVEVLRVSLTRFAELDDLADVVTKPGEAHLSVTYNNIWDTTSLGLKFQEKPLDEMKALLTAMPRPMFVGARTTAPLLIEK